MPGLIFLYCNRLQQGSRNGIGNRILANMYSQQSAIDFGIEVHPNLGIISHKHLEAVVVDIMTKLARI